MTGQVEQWAIFAVKSSTSILTLTVVYPVMPRGTDISVTNYYAATVIYGTVNNGAVSIAGKLRGDAATPTWITKEVS